MYTKELQEAGMKVIHVCASVTHALKAQKAGVDAIVASGTEGGGHRFRPKHRFCLVPQASPRAVKIPVIAGGGIADGRQLTAALALGAEANYLGTRFIATRECPAHETFKKVIKTAKTAIPSLSATEWWQNQKPAIGIYGRTTGLLENGTHR